MAEEFVRQGGLSLLEAIQYNSEGEIRQRATHLLERHLSSSSYIPVRMKKLNVLLAPFVLIAHFFSSRLMTFYVLQVDNWTNQNASPSSACCATKHQFNEDIVYYLVQSVSWTNGVFVFKAIFLYFLISAAILMYISFSKVNTGILMYWSWKFFF